MKRILAGITAILILLLSACAAKPAEQADFIAATTAPVAEIARTLLDGTGVEVRQLITEQVSCLHDYSLSVEQMKTAQSSAAVVISGLGLEDFMEDALRGCQVIDASAQVDAMPGEDGKDPHIWMAPENMVRMTKSVSEGLQTRFPDNAASIRQNEAGYCEKLDELSAYGQEQLQNLSCRKLVTFHDGFAYFAEAFDLEIAAAMEVEPGSEPSAKELEAVIAVVEENVIPAVFTERNGTADAAELVARETGVKTASLDLAMNLDGRTYFDAVKANIDTIKDVLG